MNLSATRVADELDHAADLLATHGADTLRRVTDLALGASGSGGPGPINQIGDPTGNAATSSPDRLAGLAPRWHIACADLRRHAHAHRLPATDAHTAAQALAAWLRTTGSHPTNEGLRTLWKASQEIHHIVWETVPIDREQAEEELREAEYHRHRADDCRACGVPIDKPENRKLGLYDQWCYKRIDQWRRANPGLVIDDHHESFCAYIRERIANRMPGFDRPASIHSPIGRQMIPEGWMPSEGDPAA